MVVSRKKGEAIRIIAQEDVVLKAGEEVQVEICRIIGNRVRVGITAKPELLVLRAEEEIRSVADKKSAKRVKQ